MFSLKSTIFFYKIALITVLSFTVAFVGLAAFGCRSNAVQSFYVIKAAYTGTATVHLKKRSIGDMMDSMEKSADRVGDKAENIGSQGAQNAIEEMLGSTKLIVYVGAGGLCFGESDLVCAASKSSPDEKDPLKLVDIFNHYPRMILPFWFLIFAFGIIGLSLIGSVLISMIDTRKSLIKITDGLLVLGCIVLLMGALQAELVIRGTLDMIRDVPFSILTATRGYIASAMIWAGGSWVAIILRRLIKNKGEGRMLNKVGQMSKV
ncbi:hypothetical protein NEOLI_002610 [Neolecta irregularis DAH-3]|uniref:Uncharacterized protein n=1 Tax=Neolecta irregularis (strain DAH-3) TaxID=1198029 RepID=A0A1U7LRS1_NEOID|nr:hypothetical protein NEOLI_002610 [Neolecta irregularis DAH-3]|eukprot:OLL25357.1 hypothetical protein NEOLI_002610 [Neolecta irregularis DAH-3]